MPKPRPDIEQMREDAPSWIGRILSQFTGEVREDVEAVLDIVDDYLEIAGDPNDIVGRISGDHIALSIRNLDDLVTILQQDYDVKDVDVQPLRDIVTELNDWQVSQRSAPGPELFL